eukprot:gene15948-11522_t
MAEAFGGGGGGDGEDKGPQYTPAVTELDILDEVEVAIEQATHLSVEKNGVGSSVKVVCDNLDAVAMLGSRGHVAAVTMELVKNSMGAMFKLHGIDVDEEPPIVLELGVRVSDTGSGWPAGGAGGVTQYFHSTVPYVEPTIARFYQGRLELTGVPGYCTEATAIMKLDASV